MKEWLIEVLLKKAGPSAIRGAVLGLSGWLITKEGLLSAYGVVSDATAHTTTLYWDKLSMALILALPAVIAAGIKVVNHQGNAVVKKVINPNE